MKTGSWLTMALAVGLAGGCGLSELEMAQRDEYKRNGIVYYQSAQYEQCRDQLEKALAVDPDDYDSLLMLGYAYLLQPKGDMIVEAGNVFQACIDRKPDDAQAHLGHGITCFLLGVYFEIQSGDKAEEAAQHRKRAADESMLPDQKAHHLTQAENLDKESADCREKTKYWYPKADHGLARAQALAPENPFILQMLAFNQIKIGPQNFPQAIAQFQRFIDLREKNLADARAALEEQIKYGTLPVGKEIEANRDLATMEADLRKARSMCAWLHIMLARRNPADSARHFVAAQEHLEKATFLDPHNPTSYLNQAKLSFEKYRLAEKAGDREGMLRHLQRAHNELFMFQERNAFSSPVLNVMAVDSIKFLNERMNEIQAGTEVEGETGG